MIPNNQFWFNNKVSSAFANAVLWLDAALGKTGNPVSQWDDQSDNNNDVTQGTLADRPTDNTTHLTFDGTDNMSKVNNSTFDLKKSLTLYARFSTLSAVTFQGLIDKWVNVSGGYMLFLNGTIRGSISAYFRKTSVNLTTTTVLSGGVVRGLHATIDCTRKFFGKQYLFDGELPSLLKEGSEYWCYFDKWNGSSFDVYRRTGTSLATLTDETLILAGHQYARVTKLGSTYRMLVCASGNLTALKLYTSSDGVGWTFIATVLSIGAPASFDDLYADNAAEYYLGGVYYIFYEAWRSSDNSACIGYATSNDGINYTKQGVAIARDAGVNDIGYTTYADPGNIIEYKAGSYIMFVTGFNLGATKQQQTFYTSTDLVTWTKYSGGAIHYFTGESYEDGIYGPNEFSVILENGIYYCVYRTDNTAVAAFKLGIVNFRQDPSTLLPISGNETITTNIYVNNVLEGTNVISGLYGIDYITQSSQDLYIGGDGASTSKFVGNMYGARIYNTAEESID